MFCLHTNTFEMSSPQGIGDSSQGFANCVLFCVLSVRVRRRICKPCERCYSRKSSAIAPIQGGNSNSNRQRQIFNLDVMRKSSGNKTQSTGHRNPETGEQGMHSRWSENFMNGESRVGGFQNNCASASSGICTHQHTHTRARAKRSFLSRQIFFF